MKHLINQRHIPLLQRLGNGLRMALLAVAAIGAFGLGQTSALAVALSNGQLYVDIRTDNGAIDTALLNSKDFFNEPQFRTGAFKEVLIRPPFFIIPQRV